jgi:hypothetical protein
MVVTSKFKNTRTSEESGHLIQLREWLQAGRPGFNARKKYFSAPRSIFHDPFIKVTGCVLDEWDLSPCRGRFYFPPLLRPDLPLDSPSPFLITHLAVRCRSVKQKIHHYRGMELMVRFAHSLYVFMARGKTSEFSHTESKTACVGLSCILKTVMGESWGRWNVLNETILDPHRIRLSVPC